MFPEPVSPDLGTFFLPGTSKKERVIERNTTVIHLYKSNGFNMVLDVNSGSVHVVDDCVYDVLSCMNEGKNAEEAAEALSSKYAEQDITKPEKKFRNLQITACSLQKTFTKTQSISFPTVRPS